MQREGRDKSLQKRGTFLWQIALNKWEGLEAGGSQRINGWSPEETDKGA